MIIAHHEELIEQGIRNIINNIGLYHEVKNLDDWWCICDAWLRCLEEEGPRTTQSQDREAILLGHDYLAYILHPKYRGERLQPDQIEQAHALLNAKNADFLVQLCSFQAETEPFLKSMFHAAWIENVEPSVWWTSIRKSCKNFNAERCDLAITLLHLPSSSASIERIFSNFGMI